MCKKKKNSMIGYECKGRMTLLLLFFFGWVIVYAGARTPKLTVTRITGVPLRPEGPVGHCYYLRSDNEILEEFDYVGTAVLEIYMLNDWF